MRIKTYIQVTVGTEDLRFNNPVIVSNIFLDGKDVIHIVDERTHLEERFLKTQTVADIY